MKWFEIQTKPFKDWLDVSNKKKVKNQSLQQAKQK